MYPTVIDVWVSPVGVREHANKEYKRQQGTKKKKRGKNACVHMKETMVYRQETHTRKTLYIQSIENGKKGFFFFKGSSRWVYKTKRIDALLYIQLKKKKKTNVIKIILRKKK